MAEFDTSVQHTGVVVKQENNHVWVKIRQTSACSGCHAASACGAADSREKIIMALDATGELNVGDHATLEGNYHTGLNAVALSYVVPCLLVVGVLIGGKTMFELSDLWVGLASLLILAPYYGGLYLFRGRYGKAFLFIAKRNRIVTTN